MIIREYSQIDFGRLLQIHGENGLPENCFPELVTQDQRTGRIVDNPLFIVKQVVDQAGLPVMAGFAKCTSEAFVIVDHSAGTPELRLEWLKELTRTVSSMAWARGLDELTAWLPPALEQSFSKRLEALNFVKSPWASYSLKLHGNLPHT